jgi:uncharacterized lipoprotein YmbA
MRLLFLNHFGFIVLAAVVMTVFSGCGSSTPSRFYTLSPTKNVTGNVQTDPLSTPIAVGIRTLKLPEYLLRQQIIKRSSNKVVLAEFDRWAEPLEANFKRVLVEDLSYDVPTNNIFLFPAHDSSVVNYQLLLEVTEFEFTGDNRVTLSARWGLAKGESITFLMDKRSLLSEQVSTDSFEEIVAAMSRLVGKLSQEIAMEIRTRVSQGK